jgi:Protein of unknown function (DUF3108)
MVLVRLCSPVRRRAAFAALSMLGCLATLSPAHAQRGAPETTADWPSQVRAAYTINFGAFGDIGTFNFQSSVTPDGYALNANADLKVPLLFTWATRMTSDGRIAGEKPLPTTYNFQAVARPVIGGERGQTIRMGFRDQKVAALTIVPPSPTPGPEFVPLTEASTHDVFDPLAAILAMSRVKGDANPCNRRLAIFDGKQRFDLVLTAAGQQRVPEVRPSGQPVMGPVCKVRYLPVAGYKDNAETSRLAKESGIQIAFRPVPSANLVVPYQITVPTPAGTATITLQRMDIVAPGQKQIALVH